MKKLFSLFLLVNWVTMCSAQSTIAEPDSLKKVLYSIPEDNKEKAELFIQTSALEMEMDLFDARIFAEQGLAIARKLSNAELMGKAYNQLGKLCVKENRFDSAVIYFKMAINSFSTLSNPDELAACYNEFGLLFENQTDYVEAFKYYMKALRIYDQSGNQEGMAKEYLNIGLINQYRKNYTTAEKYFNQALLIARKNKLTDLEASSINNMGVNYELLKDYPKALKHFKRVLEIDKASGIKGNIASSLNNVGTIYDDLKDYPSALSYYLQSLKLKEELNDKVSLRNTYNNVGSVYVNLHRFEEAEKYLNASLALHTEHGINAYHKETYFNFYLLYKEKKEFAKALDYFVRYSDIKDSVQLKEKEFAIEQIQNQYDFDKINKDLEGKNVELEKEVQKRYVFTAVALFLILACGFLIYSFRRIKKLNLLLNKQQEEIQQNNDSLRQKNLDIAKARQHAEDAAKSKGQFLSVMSHEIRTPLNAIIGIANLLHDSELNGEQRRIMQILKSSSDNLMALINDILDVSKIESGKLHLEYVDFSLKDVVENLYDLFLLRSREKGLQLVLKYDEKLNQKLLGDPLRINQILSNLIGNAIKFTDRGTIQIIVKQIGEGKDYHDIHFEVKDTGIGIPLDKQSTIFESFEQADKKTTRIYGGTGLGLSISKQLLEMLGSDLLLKSEEGVGSSFYFTIRFNKIHPDAPENEMEDSETLKRLEGKRILIAEDNPVNVYILKQFLGKWNMQVKVTDDGIKTVEAALNYNFDIILMDINMPLLDGYEAAKRILAVKPELPIVAITATTLSETTEMMKKSGIVDYVPKPFQPAELVQKILLNLRS